MGALRKYRVACVIMKQVLGNLIIVPYTLYKRPQDIYILSLDKNI